LQAFFAGFVTAVAAFIRCIFRPSPSALFWLALSISNDSFLVAILKCSVMIVKNEKKPTDMEGADVADVTLGLAF
jgi:hypothetical protein